METRLLPQVEAALIEVLEEKQLVTEDQKQSNMNISTNIK